MKNNKLIAIFILLGILISCSSKKTLIQEVKGDTIKKITEALYSAQREGELNRDEALNKISSITINDTKGKSIEYHQYETDGSLYEKTIYERNSHGVFLSSTKFGNDKLFKSKSQAKYDAQGNMIIVETYDLNNKLNSIQESEYDKNGNELSLSRTDKVRDKVWLTKKIYDNQNQMIEKIEYSPDGSLRDKRTFVYDEKGNEIESILTRPNGDYTKFISEYDEFNNMIVQYWYKEDGTQKHKTSFEYIYDENNNWITRRRFSNDELGMVWERIIEYY